MDISQLSLEELADLLSDKTAMYHKLMVDHLKDSDADLNSFALLKGELKDIQAEINKRYMTKPSGN